MNSQTHLFLAFTLLSGLSLNAQAQLVVPPNANIDMGGGRTDMSCLPVDIGGTYSGNLIRSGPTQIRTGGRLLANGAMQFGASLDNQGTLDQGTATITLDGSCAPAGSSIALSGTLTVPNLTIASTSGQTFVLQPGTQITVTNHLTLQGTPNAPLTLTTADGQPITIQLGPLAQVTQTDVRPVNVNTGTPGPVPVPVTLQPVPALDAPHLGLLGLLMLLASRLGLQRHRRTTPSRPRTTRPQP